MPTPLQIRLIHTAVRQLKWADAQYRFVLRNVGNAGSSKELTQERFEDVMAVMEDSGFRQPNTPAAYWREKVAGRGGFCSDRLAFVIREMAEETRYDLKGFCRRVSGGRAEQPERLYPHEGHILITALRDIVARGGAAAMEGIEGVSPAHEPRSEPRTAQRSAADSEGSDGLEAQGAEPPAPPPPPPASPSQCSPAAAGPAISPRPKSADDLFWGRPSSHPKDRKR
jgi:hypothetical protein